MNNSHRNNSSIGTILWRMSIYAVLAVVVVFLGIIVNNQRLILYPEKTAFIPVPQLPAPCSVPKTSMTADIVFTLSEVAGRRRDIQGIDFSPSYDPSRATHQIQGDSLVAYYSINTTNPEVYPACLLVYMQGKGMSKQLARFIDFGHIQATRQHTITNSILLPLDMFPFYTNDKNLNKPVPHEIDITLSFVVVTQDINGNFKAYHHAPYTFQREQYR